MYSETLSFYKIEFWRVRFERIREAECDESSSDNEVDITSSDIENVDMSAASDWCVIITINPLPMPSRFYFSKFIKCWDMWRYFCINYNFILLYRCLTFYGEKIVQSHNITDLDFFLMYVFQITFEYLIF